MPMPAAPKIYHIVHVDRLPSIVADDNLWSDAEIVQRNPPGTTIGMNSIKHRRLHELDLTSRPGLRVGACVPFYFCPRSIMLFLIYRANHPELTYRGGQDRIIHLEADLYVSVAWAEKNGLKWAFTLSNAGAYYFDDYCDLGQLNNIDWDAVQANRWSGTGISRSVQEGKQAEFLIEQSFPWNLVSRIGVRSQQVYDRVRTGLEASQHRPRVEIKSNWYY